MIDGIGAELALLIFLAAILYSSVGHAGASGYLAVMSVFSIAPEIMRPTALVLNILVATIATWRFARSGFFSWRLFWPFALGAIPLAWLGGSLKLPTDQFKVLIGFVLLFSALRLIFDRPSQDKPLRSFSPIAATCIGAGLGFLAGLTGTGGGIFLSPLMIFMRWANAKTVAAVSAAFILFNSLSGIGGFIMQGGVIPSWSWTLGLFAAAGGALGSYLGSQRLPNPALRRVLGVVLIVAGTKLVWSILI